MTTSSYPLNASSEGIIDTQQFGPSFNPLLDSRVPTTGGGVQHSDLIKIARQCILSADRNTLLQLSALLSDFATKDRSVAEELDSLIHQALMTSDSSNMNEQPSTLISMRENTVNMKDSLEPSQITARRDRASTNWDDYLMEPEREDKRVCLLSE